MTAQRKTKSREATPIRSEAESNPYAVVAGAFGIGFVLGGGLFTRLTGRIVSVVLRAGLMAALPQLQDALISVADRTLRGDRAEKATDMEEASP